MASKTIRNPHYYGLLIEEDGMTVTIARGAIVYGEIRTYGNVSDITLKIDGVATASENPGITFAAIAAKILVGKSGQVAMEAIDISGPDSLMRNSGSMLVDEIILSGVNDRFENRGRVFTEGFQFTGVGGVLVNEKGGVVDSNTTAINVSTTEGTVTQLFNHGVFKSQIFLQGGDGVEEIYSDGSIGDIYTQGGDDRIDVRGSSIFGRIRAGAGDDYIDVRNIEVIRDEGYWGQDGNDSYIVSSAGTNISEGIDGGIDAVGSVVGYTLRDNFENLQLMGRKAINGIGNALENIIVGNGADNKLFGLAGNDKLHGGKGDDRLTGGEGADSFVFVDGYGRDTIVDYQKDEDGIDLSEWVALGGFEAMMQDHVAFKAGNMVISAGKDRLTILGVGSQADFAETDFTF